MSQADVRYQQFLQMVEEVAQLVKAAQPTFARLSMQGWGDTTRRMLEKLSSDVFRVIILGEFKRGKSTFINALLGREVLPAFATPCTAIINEVKWGAEPRAVLHFRSPPPRRLPDGLAREACAHLERYRDQNVPPLQIRVEDLESFVVIPDPTRDQAASVAETPYDRVEIFWPLPLLKNGVEIIDSPGLNEHGSRTRVTMDYLGKVDAVVFVISVHALASQSELTVIDNDVRGSGHDHVFFVCNRFDELRKADDRDRVVRYSYEQLAPRTAMDRDGVFFVSALDAVIAREEGKPELLERSKIPLLEDSLARFLVTDRGRIKLLQPASLLAQGVKTALLEVIPNQRTMLSANIADLEKRFAAAEPKLKDADARRELILARLDKARLEMRDAVRDAARRHLRDVASSIPMWTTQLDVESRLSMLKVFNLKSQIEALTTETVAGVSQKIEAAADVWRVQQLQPLVVERIAAINEAANRAVEEFVADLDAVREELMNLSDSAAPQRKLSTGGGATLDASSAGSHAGAGLVRTAPGAAVTTAGIGQEAILKQLVPQILLLFAGTAILHLNPVTLAAAMIGMGIFGGMNQGQALTRRAKSEIGRHLADHVTGAIPEHVDLIAQTVYEQSEPLLHQVDAALVAEIDAIREQVKAVLATKQAGIEQVNHQLGTLSQSEGELQELLARISPTIDRISHMS